jgi:methylglyoxal synthase
MEHSELTVEQRKRIALVAHDNKKQDLLEWARFNRDRLAEHVIYATGTTGRVLEQELDFDVIKLQSGPLGGDQQIGAKIAEGEIDLLVFSGTRSSPCPTIPMSRPSCASPWFGTSQWPATAPLPISSSRRR